MSTDFQESQPNPDMIRIKAEKILYRIFGYSSFRPGQFQVIQALLQHRNVFAMLPTGSGKSMCYQIPGYMLSGLVLIVSPLLSLMEDQVHALRRSGESCVRALNSMLSRKDQRSILNKLDALRFLFISPEMLRRPAVYSALARTRVSLFVVDEAHCISQWGHEFRPDYLHLAEIRSVIGQPVCLALTATADRRVREDIIQHLELDGCECVIQSVDRPNIALLVREVKSNEEKTARLLRLITSVRLPGIIYCSSRGWTERLTGYICRETRLRAAFYHGGMTPEDRRRIQNQFLGNELDVLCCTNAFGMGINKPDVRLVVHFHYPPHLNAYLQEIGRAGRDGGSSLAVLYHTGADDRLPQALIDSNYPSEDVLQSILVRLDQGLFDIENEQHFLSMMGHEPLSEAAARYLLEQVRNKPEGHAFRSMRDCILEKIRVRRRSQFADLAQMRQWISETGCRRDACLNLFGEQPATKPRLCCDHCGVTVNDFLRKKEPVGPNRSLPDWESRLRKLLMMEEAD